MADINSHHFSRPKSQQDLREPSSRGAHVDASLAIHAETFGSELLA